ncbi:hypothetical protein HYV82_02365 [Candidatus Woesearchaeota archaeon]|nr:hypothetical protein [Candidatus Woesearchaeota archaeon]
MMMADLIETGIYVGTEGSSITAWYYDGRNYYFFPNLQPDGARAAGEIIAKMRERFGIHAPILVVHQDIPERLMKEGLKPLDSSGQKGLQEGLINSLRSLESIAASGSNWPELYTGSRIRH